MLSKQQNFFIFCLPTAAKSHLAALYSINPFFKVFRIDAATEIRPGVLATQPAFLQLLS